MPGRNAARGDVFAGLKTFLGSKSVNPTKPKRINKRKTVGRFYRELAFECLRRKRGPHRSSANHDTNRLLQFPNPTQIQFKKEVFMSMSIKPRICAFVPALLSIFFVTSAQAITVSKNSGATTPNLLDFAAAFANHPNKSGYQNTTLDRMFVETFRATCPQGQKVSAANFSITVRKLTQGANRGDNDALAFWDTQTQIFNTYLWAATDAPGTTKTLNYDISALPGATGVNGNPSVGNGVISSPGNGLGLLSDFDFSFSVQDDTSVLAATLEYKCDGGSPGGGKKGLTFGQYPLHAVSGIATAACQGQPGPACNASQGDQFCATALPVLCMKPSSLQNPTSNTADPQHWSGNVIATTPAVSPTAMPWTHKSQVDAYCVAQFGAGWVVADFHAGQNQGWKFGAYGHVGDATKRSWVNIRDQANGNCWDQQ